jgi:aspartyl-tRNA(Asn)/glutamyl-tRNA(Gln) amidotransferase subunit C
MANSENSESQNAKNTVSKRLTFHRARVMNSPDLNVRDIARLARVALSDAEAAQFQTQLSSVLSFVAQLDEVDVSGVEPTAHAQELGNVMRPDMSRPSFTPEEALANAPAQSGGQFQVVRVVN